MDAVTITALDHYVDEVLAAADSDELLLRGHRCRSWPMTPGLARLSCRGGETLLDVEQRLIAEFTRRCLPYVQRELKDEWDLLAMAQHHGLATRLLDWTANPLAALWFAVAEPATNNEPGVVFAFAPEPDDYVDKAKTAPYEVDRTLFFQPSHLNARIVAQSGWFSVHKWNAQQGRLTRIDGIARYRDRVRCFEIPSGSFADLRAGLDRMGVNRASLFPDLDGLTRHLNWQNSLLPDES